MNIEEILDKYSDSINEKLNLENIAKIIYFLKEKNCTYIKDILEDYMDIFTIEYDVFVSRFNHLDEKYNNRYINICNVNMNHLEELFNE